MANANIPRGIIPYAYRSGAPYNGAVRVYYKPATANALYIGDPVLVLAATADANGVPGIDIATAGATNYLTGSFAGVANNAGQLVIPVLQGNPVYLPASTAAYIYVADDPTLLYWAQEDSDGGAMAATEASGNVDLVAGTGSTVTSYSGWELNSNTAGTGATLQMRIIQALQQPDNAIGDYAKWLVSINLHSLTNTSGV